MLSPEAVTQPEWDGICVWRLLASQAEAPAVVSPTVENVSWELLQLRRIHFLLTLVPPAWWSESLLYGAWSVLVKTDHSSLATAGRQRWLTQMNVTMSSWMEVSWWWQRVIIKLGWWGWWYQIISSSWWWWCWQRCKNQVPWVSWHPIFLFQIFR